MSDLSPLADLQRFTGLSDSARAQLAADLAVRLGTDWSPAPHEEIDAVPLVHGPTAARFLAVPGGSYTMGFSDADMAALKAAVPWSAEIESTVTKMLPHVTPAHHVSVSPFIVMRAPLTAKEVERLSSGRFNGKYCHTLLREEALGFSRSLGFRLASEAELQWLLRDGGVTSFTLDAAAMVDEVAGDSEAIPSRFGMEGAFFQQWADDSYHEDYTGAPDTSIPWAGGEPCGVATGGTMPEYVEEPHQKVGLLACLRTNRTHKKAHVRFALDLTLA